MDSEHLQMIPIGIFDLPHHPTFDRACARPRACPKTRLVTTMKRRPKVSKSNYLREWRAAWGMTQSEVAAMLGYNKPAISRIENCKVRLCDVHMHVIARATGIKPGDLLEPPAAVLKGQRP